MRLALALTALLFAAPALAETPAACGPQTEVPEADRLANNVRWSTASEQDNFGYDVYRGAEEEGPFEKLNPSPILGHGTTDETNRYEWRDDTIDPCAAYWYYVESISTSGDREKFTPVVRVAPKVGADAPAAAGDAD